MAEGRIKKIKKARFALPSLVTLGSVFCGFLSMTFAMKAQALTGDARIDLLQYAALAIIGSIIFDTFDGKVARLTKTSTKFGMELDSLSDGVSFGVAPAMLMYGFALNQAGIFGIIAVFLYASGALLRLARFNIEAPDEGVQTYFKGIPSPAGAACIAAIVLAAIDTEFTEFTSFELNTLAVISIVAGLLMVSNVKYKTLKGKKTKGDYAFIIIGLLLFGTMCFVQTPAISFFLLVCYFVIYGMLLTIYLNLKQGPRRRHRDKSRKKAKNGNEEKTIEKDASADEIKEEKSESEKTTESDADNTKPANVEETPKSDKD